MSKIKIFVSHRIDLNSELIKNSLYQHMRCGAVYDKRDIKIKGDDTGENISSKRASFNELTVQYWAWKNCEADYYGLSHYRRYLSFSDTEYPIHRFYVSEREHLVKSAQRYSLENEKKMRKTIGQYDLLVPQAADIKNIPVLLPKQKPIEVKSIYEFWANKTNQFDVECLEFTKELVKKRQPKYYPYLIEYLEGTKFRGSNNFILRKELFDEMCEFQFDILFELEKKYDMSSYEGEWVRQPGFIGEILYAVFMLYLEKQNKYKIKYLQLILFAQTEKIDDKKIVRGNVKMGIKAKIRDWLKSTGEKMMPAYRVALRTEETLQYLLAEQQRLKYNVDIALNKAKPSPVKNKKPPATQEEWDKRTLTANVNLSIACFANEVYETHKAAFLEFKRCNTGRDVVILATGPTMAYYGGIDGAVHIGVNKAFKNEKVNLDYYFTTDYKHKNKWMDELKEYDFVKFFGQYSAGIYRDAFQVPERMIAENNGRKFFQGAPSEDIHVNIEYYPLMAFYSIAFQALQFATYTNAKRIFLVGCDCSSTGYFDGTLQVSANPPLWIRGYKKFKAFAEQFYPDTEIISVNPIGLKGIFKDVYTQSYLDENPEINKKDCEIL